MRRVRLPSPAALIALLALFVALGGPAEAAKLIKGKDIKRNAIRASTSRTARCACPTCPGRHAGAHRDAGELDRSDRSPTARSPAPTWPRVPSTARTSPTSRSRGRHRDERHHGGRGRSELDPGRRARGRPPGSARRGQLRRHAGARLPGDRHGDCAFIDADVTAVATSPRRSRWATTSCSVTPPASFPDDALALSAAPSSRDQAPRAGLQLQRGRDGRRPLDDLPLHLVRLVILRHGRRAVSDWWPLKTSSGS